MFWFKRSITFVMLIALLNLTPQAKVFGRPPSGDAPFQGSTKEFEIRNDRPYLAGPYAETFSP